jgi:hypothetical protein
VPLRYTSGTMTRDVWLLVLGAFLGFAGGVTANFIQWFWNRHIAKKNAIVLVCHLLDDFDRVAARIAETYDKSKTLWNDLLNQLSTDLTLFDRNQEFMIVQKSLASQADVWDWFSRLRVTTTMSQGANRLIQDGQNVDFAQEQIKKLVSDYKDLRISGKVIRGRLKKS